MRHDVVVVGDGPAGSALSAALVDVGVGVVLVGGDVPWTATYGTWLDELPERYAGAQAAVAAVDVFGARAHHLERTYATFDNDLLRAATRRAPHLIGRVADVHEVDEGVRVVTDDRDALVAKLVIDATGSPPAIAGTGAPHRVLGGGGWAASSRRRRPAGGWQTAYGVVVPERPPELGGGDRAVLMDWRPPPEPRRGAGAGADARAHAPTDATFAYVVPVGGGRWLVEETSLVRRQPMPSGALRTRLAARLGRDPTDGAERVEHVAIPMVGGVPRRSGRVVAFGAAAGYLHPATGYSVTASLRAAPRVAAEVATAIDAGCGPDELADRAWSAVWPAQLRRTRALHDRGVAALLRMEPDDVRAFFDAFFDLPQPMWSAYLRIDASPRAVSRAMAQVFSASPWGLRRRLAMGRPLHSAAARLRRRDPGASPPIVGPPAPTPPPPPR